MGLASVDTTLHVLCGPFSRIKYVPFNISSRQISNYLIRKGSQRGPEN